MTKTKPTARKPPTKGNGGKFAGNRINKANHSMNAGNTAALSMEHMAPPTPEKLSDEISLIFVANHSCILSIFARGRNRDIMKFVIFAACLCFLVFPELIRLCDL